ncbi:MAG: TetR/AcrR family transcriptional regulator [Microbacterium sp.]|jgi:AcrR family transcriptional regulator|nr:TetR/AcrR family transcriptional regulator [Microbacterium sp.]
MPSKGERTQQRIILAALELFSERGFMATSVRDIAARAEMTHAGLLHHFASKDDLLVRILAFREDQDVINARRFSDYGIDRLFAWIIDVVQANEADSSRVMAFVRLSAEATDPDHPAYAYFSRRYERVLTALDDAFAAHFAVFPPPHPITSRDAAIGIVALMDGLQLQWLIRPDSVDMTGMVRQHLAALGVSVPDRHDTVLHPTSSPDRRSSP